MLSLLSTLCFFRFYFPFTRLLCLLWFSYAILCLSVHPLELPSTRSLCFAHFYCTFYFVNSALLLLFSNGFALHHAYFAFTAYSAYSANFSASISLKLFISNHKPLLHPSWEGCQQIHWILFPCTRNRGSLQGHTKLEAPLISTLLTSRSRTYVT